MMSVKVAIQLLVFYFVFTMFTAQHVWGEQDCYEEKRLLKQHCLRSIINMGRYLPPTAICMIVVETSDMNCICRVINDEDEQALNMEKIVRLARECGNPVTDEKCGSKYTKILNSFF
ncbi:hypothetical protein HU200_021676 [Digitaria exilis]|uniref:Bifunctional inhibitor/plant lipid transfer protein/seed storage helical domain-containing protein n=1 Tax=Digitaria exilis TaxID=1010633 RepID=A0A835A2K0_9POAL|nr:hypothetical protein HU200_063899 [Digitaria exilis]KAF8723712.1 hypothetical protein HU200_021676 [Digitaria exilis]